MRVQLLHICFDGVRQPTLTESRTQEYSLTSQIQETSAPSKEGTEGESNKHR